MYLIPFPFLCCFLALESTLIPDVLTLIHCTILSRRKNLIFDSLLSGSGARQNELSFFFFFFGAMACGNLVPPPGIEPVPAAWECRVLNAGPPGKSQDELLKPS